MAAQAWLDEKPVLPERPEVPCELEEWGIFEALDEQKHIGWNNFFKGRVSSKFGDIQMAAHNADDTLAKAHRVEQFFQRESLK